MITSCIAGGRNLYGKPAEIPEKKKNLNVVQVEGRGGIGGWGTEAEVRLEEPLEKLRVGKRIEKKEAS